VLYLGAQKNLMERALKLLHNIGRYSFHRANKKECRLLTFFLCCLVAIARALILITTAPMHTRLNGASASLAGDTLMSVPCVGTLAAPWKDVDFPSHAQGNWIDT
jgi:hypothetical protein